MYEAATTHRAAGHALVVVAGRNGAGSSRDRAVKAPAPLGVRAVIAVSCERIHRSNLIGTGVLPIEFTGAEDLAFEGLDDLRVGTDAVVLGVGAPDGSETTTDLRLRVFSRRELAYLRHGGVLPYVVRRTLASRARPPAASAADAMRRA
ncbi:aconitate hydratase [Streptomyces sp. NPDC048291]|uniref:aconitate hydratase n=1 Tax=Streptomyces sp. NPDC048291 TaxID=3365530 RepID=UPI00371B4B4B